MAEQPATAVDELLQDHPKADRITLTKLLDKAQRERLEQQLSARAARLNAVLDAMLHDSTK